MPAGQSDVGIEQNPSEVITHRKFFALQQVIEQDTGSFEIS
jgi:hypothetical protein